MILGTGPQPAPPRPIYVVAPRPSRDRPQLHLANVGWVHDRPLPRKRPPVLPGAETDRYVLVGHSLGGGTALQAALQHPRAFKGLVLVAPTPAAGISSYVSHEQLESVISPTGDQLATFAGAAFHRQLDQQLFYCLLVTVQVASPRHVEGAMRSQHAFDVTGQLGGTAAQADPRPVAFAHARERAQPAHPIRPAGRPDRRLDPLLDAIVVHRRSAASCPCPASTARTAGRRLRTRSRSQAPTRTASASTPNSTSPADLTTT